MTCPSHSIVIGSSTARDDAASNSAMFAERITIKPERLLIAS
jgi:hypothetical protein